MNKVNILVVDDRPEGLMAVEAVLKSTNYNLVTAASGNEALKHLLNYDFAVILLDVQMPIMNGFETASIIKTREKTKDIPIIFMSAINQDEQYVYQGYGVGAVDYLMKPFDPYILQSKVSIFVDMYLKKQLIKEQAQKLRDSEARAHALELTKIEIENLRRYKNLADSIPQIVLRLEKSGEFKYFNKVWFEYTGLSQISSEKYKWISVLHPEDAQVLKKLLAGQNNEVIECEVRILNKEGEFRWHLLRLQKEVEDASPDNFNWLGTATDIEDRKRNEEMQMFLANAGESLVSSIDYKKTLESIALLAVPRLGDWCTVDMVTEDATLENVVLTHRESGCKKAVQIIHDSYLHKGIEEVLTTGKYALYEYSSDRYKKLIPDNEENEELLSRLGNCSVVIIPLIFHGKNLGAFTIGRPGATKFDHVYLDTAKEFASRITFAFENSQLYKLSQEAIQIRNDFLSIASHELNTPITSLKLQLQMLSKNVLIPNNSDKVGKNVSTSLRQVDRLINLIQILLDVSRIQSGKLVLSHFEFNLQELVSEVIDRHKEIILDAECSLEVHNDVPITVFWDKTRIEQVITNLLVNAIKYAPGKIELSLKEDGEAVIIEVRDHGPGISSKKLASIFNRFERATTNETVSGLGLGLYIVKQISEAHNGKVTVESKEGDGTAFRVRLPRRSDQFREEGPAASIEQQIH